MRSLTPNRRSSVAMARDTEGWDREFARGFGEASALNRPHKQGELQQPIIHTSVAYIISSFAQYPSRHALLSSRPRLSVPIMRPPER